MISLLMSKLWCFTPACTRECFWKGLKPSLFSSHDKCPRSTLPHHCIVWHDLMSCCEVQATPPTLQTDKHCLVFAQVVPSTQIFVCSFAWTATEEENSKLIRGSWYIYMHRGSPGYSYPRTHDQRIQFTDRVPAGVPLIPEHFSCSFLYQVSCLNSR